MPYRNPWNPGTEPRPGSVTISGSNDACDYCKEHHGTYDVPPGGSIKDALDGIGLPPYHPHCKCAYKIEYAGSSAYMTEEQKDAVLEVFDRMNQRYVANSRRGPVDNLLLNFLFQKLGLVREVEAHRVEDIVIEIRDGVARSCGARASELKLLFENYLRSLRHGTEGCSVEIESRETVVSER